MWCCFGLSCRRLSICCRGALTFQCHLRGHLRGPLRSYLRNDRRGDRICARRGIVVIEVVVLEFDGVLTLVLLVFLVVVGLDDVAHHRTGGGAAMLAAFLD